MAVFSSIREALADAGSTAQIALVASDITGERIYSISIDGETAIDLELIPAADNRRPSTFAMSLHFGQHDIDEILTLANLVITAANPCTFVSVGRISVGRDAGWPAVFRPFRDPTRLEIGKPTRFTFSAV